MRGPAHGQLKLGGNTRPQKDAQTYRCAVETENVYPVVSEFSPQLMRGQAMRGQTRRGLNDARTKPMIRRARFAKSNVSVVR